MASWEPQVFIIESLKFEDEKDNRFEGKILSDILLLGGKEPIYYYIRTKKEFEKVLEIFGKSEYRYLHISCHGNKNSLFTTLDALPFHEFATMINPYLNEKRLFVSACSAVNEDLAKVVIPDSDCYSLIGPINKIGFHDAAITWASFYHLMFKENPNSMKRKNIKPTLQNIVDTFEESLNYFSASETSPYYKKLLIKEILVNRKIFKLEGSYNN